MSFRSRYLDYAELTAQLTIWAKAHPEIARLSSLGRSAEGRELWLLTVGANPDDGRPAVWVDGNMHASELCGSSAALAIAEDALKLHLGENPQGLPDPVVEAIRGALFYVMPRISPDGAEGVLKTGRYIRSSPVDARQDLHRPHWKSQDLDSDGMVRLMRVVCESGELVESPAHPGLLIPRRIEHSGPFYKVYPEGTISHYDGSTIPSPNFLADNSYDFNRNFPWGWKPEPEQVGAGAYPGSAPETRAIIEFACAHPNIFAWMNFHTFGGVFIRPAGHHADHKMDQADLAVFRQIEKWNTELTGYPTVSGFHEFLYEPDKPLYGDLTDFAYNQRGAIAYVCELWDIFKQLGIERKKPFVDHYTHFDVEHYEALARWDRNSNQGRIFQPWKRFDHPQLGPVEIGGTDIRVGISNPPYELIDEVVTAQSRAFLRVASLLPRVRLDVRRLDDDTIEVLVKNQGYLATHGLASAKALPVSEPLRLSVACEGGLSLLAPDTSVIEIGHLEGWGQGLHNGGSVFLPWTRGNVSEKRLRLAFKGKGTARLTLASCRVGVSTRSVTLG